MGSARNLTQMERRLTGLDSRRVVLAQLVEYFCHPNAGSRLGVGLRHHCVDQRIKSRSFWGERGEEVFDRWGGFGCARCHSCTLLNGNALFEHDLETARLGTFTFD